MKTAFSLGAKQVGQINVLGTSIVLSLMQEEMVDLERGFIYPAKSFTVSSVDGLRALREKLDLALSEVDRREGELDAFRAPLGRSQS